MLVFYARQTVTPSLTIDIMNIIHVYVPEILQACKGKR